MGKTARKTPAEMLIELKGTETAPALDALVQRYFAMVYSTCLRITRDRHDAEDAAQASFLCLAMELRKQKIIRTPGPWLYQVACNASVDICRRRKRRLTHETLCARTESAILAEDPACRADMAEMRPAVLEALNNLPTRYRLPLILQYFGGLSHEQLARELGCTRVSLRVRLHRGHKMLRKTLEKRGICLAGGLLGVIIAEAVRSQVSDTLVGTTIALGHQASQAGLQACSAGPEILAVASHAAAPIGRAKLWLLISLIAGGLLAAGAPLLARLTQDWPSFPMPTNFTPPQLPTFTAPIPKFSSTDPKTDPTPSRDPQRTESAQAAAPATMPPAARPNCQTAVQPPPTPASPAVPDARVTRTIRPNSHPVDTPLSRTLHSRPCAAKPRA